MPTIDFKDIGHVLNHEFVQGTIATIDSAEDTCTVSVGGAVVTAPLFYHCSCGGPYTLRSSGGITGAAKAFTVGDAVYVMREITPIGSERICKVIGRVDGAKKCVEDITSGKYFIFYLDGSTVKIANCNDAMEVLSEKSSAEVAMYDTARRITFHCKRFSHKVPANGVTVTRDLYFIATSLYINPNPMLGWTNFATANPTFPLVTNNSNTQITMTSQVMADMTSVNTSVNTGHTQVVDPSGNENWHIMAAGESGDCEDFALTKAKALLDLGYPASAIHVEVGWPEGTVLTGSKMIGHAWLVVQTTAGDYALDLSRNAPIKNSALQDGNGKDYICRRRQIGSNWAFIDLWGWMTSSLNYYASSGYSSMSQCSYYIFDPLLNIFYLVPYINGQIHRWPFFGRDDEICSVNFSTDAIYVLSNRYLSEYKLGENELTLVNRTYVTYAYTTDLGPRDRYGFQMVTFNGVYVDSDGNVLTSYILSTGTTLTIPRYTVEIISAEGKYEYIFNNNWLRETRDSYWEWRCLPTVNPMIIAEAWHEFNPKPPRIDQITSYTATMLNTQSGDPFYLYTDSVNSPGQILLHVPFGNDDITVTTATAKMFMECFPWIFIHTDSLNIQGFGIEYSTTGGPLRGDYHIYQGGASILDTVLSAAGTTEENLLGFAYIPFTNRLSG